MVLFRELVEVCRRFTEISGRKDKVALLVRFLARLDPGEAEWASRLIIGRPLPEYVEEELNVGYSTLLHLEDSQSTLIADPPTVEEIGRTILDVAKAKGRGSREKKRGMLQGLLARMSEEERTWFMKMIIGEMQHGVGEGLLMEAVSEMLGTPVESIQRAYTLIGDLGTLVRTALEGGREAVESVKMTLYRPVKPMLAEDLEDPDESLREHPEGLAAEYKVDGARAQVHVGGEGVKIFSRRLNEVTASVPEVVAQVEEHVKARQAILDGEIFAVDRDGRPLPFQALLRRFRRIRNEDNSVGDIFLRLYVFDLLFLEGEELIDLPYSERWRRLESITSPEIRVPRIIVKSRADLEEAISSAVKAGHEGLVLKRVDGRYAPGRRERLWLKVKHSKTLDLVIVQADWGYGRRTGWLSNYHLAAYDPETGGYQVVGKTFKGLTDEEFEWMTKRLLELRTHESEHTVKVKPEIVVEVAYDEIQRSAKYPSGLALRFARIKRIRVDKRPWEADTLQEVRRRYLRQFEVKSARF